MANKTQQIRIESILGGQAPITNFATEDQFSWSVGIDPSWPIDDFSGVSAPAAGLLRPVTVTTMESSLSAFPVWIKLADKDKLTYVYDANGSAFVMNGISSFTTLSDGGALSNSTANGMEYCDNYMYFAKNTTVARYGPLDGTPGFDGDFWVTTLGKAQLSDTQYPKDNFVLQEYPNHVMHRHSDGKLYFADVVGNQGVIHKISTKKVTTEGDTDDGSTYNALDFGYGLWPTALETYGTDLAIALFEGPAVGSANNYKRNKAKLAFWDTTSDSPNSVIFVEFPDQMITALKNLNGVLYIVSGNEASHGFRVSRYIGGSSIEEIGYFEQGQASFPGAVDGDSNRLLLGSFTLFPYSVGCVFSIGLQKSSFGRGLFAPVITPQANNAACVYAVHLTKGGFEFNAPIIGWWDGGAGVGTHFGVSYAGGTYSNVLQTWKSRIYSIGQPFKITKVRIPFAQTLASGMQITPAISVDDDIYNTRTTYLQTITNTTNGGERKVVIKPENLVGSNNFSFSIDWEGSSLCVVSLPITIEYELLDD